MFDLGVCGHWAFAPKPEDDVAGQCARINELPRDRPHATSNGIADHCVPALGRNDYSHTISVRGAAVTDHVFSDTLVPATNHTTKIARLDNPVVAGKH